MKRLLLFILVLAAATAFADEGPWLTDFNKASELSAKENKLVLMDFTGSAWCPPCKQMKKEVLSQKDFLDFAGKNLVLFQVDMMPGGVSAVPSLDDQNQNLLRKFGIEYFPTFILINSKGKTLGQFSGYLPGGPEAFIAWVKKTAK